MIVTKPGGLSSTEGATKQKPLVFINAVPGCETRNLDFFIERNFAVTGEDINELVGVIGNLINSPDKLKSMSECVSKHFRNNAAEIIYEDIIKTLGEV